VRLVNADFENIKQSRILMYVSIFLLFVPKINLISVGTYEGAGVRLDDILILLVSPLIIYAILYKGRVSQLEFYFYIFFLYTVIIHLFNLPYSRGNILYPLRLFEYWMFFYFGRCFADQDFFLKVIAAFVIYSGILIIAQDLHLIGGYHDGNYKALLSKPTGSTNGSYEIAMVLALMSPVFLLAKNKLTTYFYVLLCVFLILLTESRSAFIIQLSTLVLWLIFTNKNNRSKKVAFFVLVSIFLISLVVVNADLFNRFFSLFTSDTYYALERIFSMSHGQSPGDGAKEFLDKQVGLKTAAAKSYLLEVGGDSGDLSTMVRFNKWMWAVNSFLAQGYFYIVIGIGGGVLGNAVDGGLVRILIEYGILGFSLFLLFLCKAVKNIRSIEFLLVISFLLGNLFIDYYLSYKVTSVFFLILGFLYSRQKRYI